jgi:hypothetical protein
MLHYGPSPKAWLPDAWRTVERNAFSLLVSRVCLDADVPVPLGRSELPLWLRPGPLGRSLLLVLDLLNRSKHFTRTWLAPRVRARLSRARRAATP